MGVDFTDFKGLIPGAMSNLNVLNPYTIMQSFLSGATPPCQELTMQTIDVNNNQSSETHFVTTIDIQNMDPCTFQNNTNPVTGKSCQETFTNNSNNNINNNNNKLLNTKIQLPDDPLLQLYIFGLSIIGIYSLYELMQKSR
jgi:hypothetical protein